MNCVKCGAPLHGLVCEYCGCEYDNNKRLKVNLDNNWCYGTLIVNGEEFDVYLTHMEMVSVDTPESGRTLDGKMHKVVLRTTRKFTLVEL